MGFWLANPKLEAGEAIRWESSAGRALNRWITSGGRLVVTNQRVLFQPNRFDAMIGRKPWGCRLAFVTGVQKVERDLSVIAGGARERLRIQTRAGVEVFVVNNATAKVAELSRLFRV
jgi:hypothetical protein